MKIQLECFDCRVKTTFQIDPAYIGLSYEEGLGEGIALVANWIVSHRDHATSIKRPTYWTIASEPT